MPRTSQPFVCPMEEGEAQPRLPRLLDDARLPQMPPSVYYIPNFITATEEERLLDKITTAPTTQWTHLSRRRLQTYPSKLTAENAMIEKALPNWLVGPVIPRLRSIPVAADDEARTSHVFSSSPHEAPNHVLVNLYEPGQGIMPHEDGAAYWPVVSTVSLGSAIVLDVYEKREDGSRREEASYRILQEPRSLLVTVDDLYVHFLHGIAETTRDEDLGPDRIANWALLGSPATYSSGTNERGTRISLTYRDVLRVVHLGNKLKLFR